MIFLGKINHLQQVEARAFDVGCFRPHQVIELPGLEHVLDLLSEISEPGVMVALADHGQHVVKNVADHFDLLTRLQLVILDAQPHRGS